MAAGVPVDGFLFAMFTPSLTPEHATTLKRLSRKHPLSPTLKKEMRLFQ